MRLTELNTRARYFLWAASQCLAADSTCPACQGRETHRVKRKWLVTSLYECASCGLRFRVPKENPDAAEGFYEADYDAGFTTDMPSGEELEQLLTTGFRGHEKDYGPYVEVLDAAGLPRDALILDFGASWGYGSWQLKQAGFQVLAYELSRTRARYAEEKLQIEVLRERDRPPRPVDCFFSAHVIEHLPDPNIIWETAAKVLRRGGLFVAFMPNGDPATEAVYGTRRYHLLWGQVHPLLISRRHLKVIGSRHGFDARVYSSPYPLEQIRKGVETGNITGHELAIVAKRAA